MALTATIFKASLSLSDMDRNHYAEYPLTLARHPSETDERMMVRLLAFALHADERLEFTRGLCVDDEPALWLKSLTGDIELWIEVGLPDERRLRKACGRADKVVLYCYGGRAVDLWWQRNQAVLQRCVNLAVIELPAESTQALAALAARGMQFQVSIQDGGVWLSSASETLAISPRPRKQAAT